MYKIQYTHKTVVGDPYCFQCGENMIGVMGQESLWKRVSEDEYVSRVHMINSGHDKFTCTTCKKEFGPFDHVTVISESWQ